MESNPVSFRIDNHRHVSVFWRDLRLGNQYFSSGFFNLVQCSLKIRISVKINKRSFGGGGLVCVLTVAQGAAYTRGVFNWKHPHLKIVQLKGCESYFED